MKDMKRVWQALMFMFFWFAFEFHVKEAQDDTGETNVADHPKEQENCNGIFLSYDFISRTKTYPLEKNASAQAWAFNATASIINTSKYELKAWKMFIKFQYDEILVTADGAVLIGGEDFPAPVGNGTYLSGSPQTDLKTAIETAGDLSQIRVLIKLSGTMFGMKPSGTPMPKTILLSNDGYKCPAPTHSKNSIYVCCIKDKKFKSTDLKTKYLPRRNGDLIIYYDVLQAYDNNYNAQVTMYNKNPLGRLDHWNLTWEWMRGEFIYSMKGAYTRIMDISDCIQGPAAKSYQQMDFSKVMNCQKKPIISDMPPEKANDTEVGKIPGCCKNGTLLPPYMDPSKSTATFQLQVFKIPPDQTRTSIFPPDKWNIVGILNPKYDCGSPMRVDPTEFPDTTGLEAIKPAISTWQVVCHITRPKKRETRCCVSFSAFYNSSVIPCNTCACGCKDTRKCNPDATAMLLPPESLLVPFENRTIKAVAWAKIKHHKVPKKLPCGDNCGVSINWHISTDYTSGWTARITLFNWQPRSFQDWFVAIKMNKAYKGFENIYSFNGSLVPELNNTIFFQGIKGMNYLLGLTNGSKPEKDPKEPGKQQSVISFTKKHTIGINIAKGDGFPSRVLFNGEECSLPTHLPTSYRNRFSVNFMLVILLVAFVMVNNHH